MSAAIRAVAVDYERKSVRQLYYRLVARGLPKTEALDKRVCDAAAQRRLGDFVAWFGDAGAAVSRRRPTGPG